MSYPLRSLAHIFSILRPYHFSFSKVDFLVLEKIHECPFVVLQLNKHKTHNNKTIISSLTSRDTGWMIEDKFVYIMYIYFQHHYSGLVS